MILTPAAIVRRRVEALAFCASYAALLAFGALAMLFAVPTASFVRNLLGGIGT